VRQTVQRFGDHHNAFGFLRLLLASLVIVSHTPQLVDGDRSRELLSRVFPSLTFGDLAVDGFFIISGFLITGSYLSSKGLVPYLRKRVARIYPGFIVSSLVCVLIVGPVTGAYFAKGPAWGFGSTVGHIALLLPPAMTNVFFGTPYRVLNGSAWTIQYEFACYLMVLLLGQAGLLRSWIPVAAASIVCLFLFGFAPKVLGDSMNRLPLHNVILLGDRSAVLRLGGLFLAGAAFYLAQDRIALKWHYLVAAFLCLCLTLLDARFAALGLGIFGSYALLAVAALGSGTILAKINNRNDISYGVYLYAWPIEKTLLWFGFSTNLLVLGFGTFFLAMVAGMISWFLIEKPAMRFGRSTTPRKTSAIKPI
jgi:peptidoglycan/LPS O-acetylase OafA/YrhL